MFTHTPDGVDLWWEMTGTGPTVAEPVVVGHVVAANRANTDQTVPVPAFVPEDFDVPRIKMFDHFRLEALGPEHNERDHTAWTSSMDHIHATPGFEGHPWPMPMTVAENLEDMDMHLREFDERTSFTWSILAAGTDDVIGCIYLYPFDPARPGHGRFRSWVTAERAADDSTIRTAIAAWFASDWPIEVTADWHAPG